MTTTQRKLGKNQRDFLELLKSHRGVWHHNSTWAWKNPSETIRLLEALGRRGYVELGEAGRWKMTHAGRLAMKYEAGAQEHQSAA